VLRDMSTLPKLSLKGAPRPAAYAAALVALLAGGWFAYAGYTKWNAYVPLGVRVLESRVDTLLIAGVPKYGAAITYEFIYDGLTMTASSVKKGNPEMSASEAASWVERYPVGLETAGFLDGTNPNDIVLVRENTWDLPALVAGLGLLAVLFLLWEDRARWLPVLRRSGGGGSSGTREFIDPRGRPPEMQMTPPPGMEGAIWDPSPDADGLPRGWVRPDDQ
jgi:hypothetical protein